MTTKSLFVSLGAIVIALALAIAGYVLWQRALPNTQDQEAALVQEAADVVGAAAEQATSGTMPSITTTNPLESKPDVNPAEKTNPFSNIKTNPFE